MRCWDERTTDGMKLTSRLLFELKMREICVNCSVGLSATGRAGSSVVVRLIAARMVTGSIPVPRFVRVSPKHRSARRFYYNCFLPIVEES